VKDSSGHSVPDLQTKDFTVTENGHQRDFVMFPVDDAPWQNSTRAAK
jgi:hypothetical protein